MDLEKTVQIIRSEKNLVVANKDFSEIRNEVGLGVEWRSFYNLLYLLVCVCSDNIIEHNLEKVNEMSLLIKYTLVHNNQCILQLTQFISLS
jgi:hypothetical protein